MNRYNGRYLKDETASQTLASITLAEDFAFPNGMKARAGKLLRFWSNQTVRSIPLAEDWQIPGGGRLRGETEAWLYPDGNWQSVVMVSDFSLGPDKPLAMAEKP